jgi:predicted GNAT family N-acyltransferase
MALSFTIEHATWEQDRKALIQIRTEVFINEQNVPPDLEWDGYDPDCWHVIAVTAAGDRIGTARMLYDGHIGRMAVLPPYRHQGIGSALLTKLLNLARHNQITEVFLNAQTSAIGFYQQHGFQICSDEFMDAGLPHYCMRKNLINPA